MSEHAEQVDLIFAYLTTGGRMGECPAWFRAIEAAKFYGCMPWDLVDEDFHGEAWVERYEIARLVRRRLAEREDHRHPGAAEAVRKRYLG